MKNHAGNARFDTKLQVVAQMNQSPSPMSIYKVTLAGEPVKSITRAMASTRLREECRFKVLDCKRSPRKRPGHKLCYCRLGRRSFDKPNTFIPKRAFR
jgi:hypothetical protein